MPSFFTAKQERALANRSIQLKFHVLCVTSGLLGETLNSWDHSASPELEDCWQGLQAEVTRRDHHAFKPLFEECSKPQRAAR